MRRLNYFSVLQCRYTDWWTEVPLYDPRMRYKDPGAVLTICDGLITEIHGTISC